MVVSYVGTVLVGNIDDMRVRHRWLVQKRAGVRHLRRVVPQLSSSVQKRLRGCPLRTACAPTNVLTLQETRIQTLVLRDT